MTHTTGETAVLLSGGVDSAVVLAAIAGRHPGTIWVNYGQPAAMAERKASLAIARHFDVPWRELVIGGVDPPSEGEFPGRNDLLVATAASAIGRGFVAIGVHAGTGYVDCSPGWAASWQALLDTQHAGRAGLMAPLVNLTKSQVYALALDYGLPLKHTYSCEAANTPCGSCASCTDRRLLDAGA